MKGLIGIGTFFGCLFGCLAAGHAAPEARIDCTGEPRLEGVDDKGVEISTDVVGLVRVVGTLEEVTDEGDDEAVMSAKAFCEAHGGVDAFILPAPRVLDEPRTPDGEDELQLERPDRPDTNGGQKAVETQDDTDDDASEDDGYGSMADLPDVAGSYKSIDHQATSASGCSQAADHSQTGWWFALLPLLLMVRVRREGDR